MFKKLFKKNRSINPNNGIVRVNLPEETLTLMKWKENGLPCIGMFNSSLKKFVNKAVFPWHLCVTILFDEVVDNGMPSIEERSLVDPFCEQLDKKIKSGGNALFFVRETWNKTRRLTWRVHDPEASQRYLQDIIDHHGHPRPFEWSMVFDPRWEKAEWYFQQLNRNG